MFGSLQTGLTGLRSNQRYLEVIGNNLSNSITAGYKADRITFRDLFYQTYREATGPSGDLGGVNAQRIGKGVTIGSIDTVHTTADLTPTGRPFDLAIEGDGFFVVSDGTEAYYTRAGTFSPDIDNFLVDNRTGFRVLNTTGQPIDLSSAQTVPARASTSVTFRGNLPAFGFDPIAEAQQSATAFEEHQPARITSTLGAAATVDLTGESLTLAIDSANPVTISFTATDFPTPLTLTQTAALINSKISALGLTRTATVSLDGTGALQIRSDATGEDSILQLSGAAASTLGFSTALVQGTEDLASSATDLNDLAQNQVDYVAGDVIRMTGFDNDGNAVNLSFTYGTDGTTLGDLVNTINNSGEYPNTTLTLGADGKLNLRSSVTGQSQLSLTIRDLSTVNRTNWGAYAFETITPGTDARPVFTSIEVFDSLGIGHQITGTFTRQDDDTWNLELEVPPNEGSLTGSPITNITFDSNGVFQGSTGTTIDLLFNNGAAPQSVTLDLGNAGIGGGLTQTGDEASANSVSQDGYAPGTLTQYVITQAGVIQGRYSNRLVVDLDSIAIALFTNRDGLAKEGATLFAATDNSGSPQIGQGGVGSRGAVRSGALEGSNVDTAEEFVRLIEAQRAFQGNARVISTSDEILAELVNIV